MKYVRIYTRQRLTILLAMICIVVFFTNRQAFLEELQHTSILPPAKHPDTSPEPVDKSSPRLEDSSPGLESPPDSPSPSSDAPTSTARSGPSPSALTTNSTSLRPDPRPANATRCSAYPENADVVIVVKTGGTETFQKIPTQLMTFLQCAKDDVLIFSDMELELGGQHIYDCLDNVIPNTKNNEDFDLYRTQQAYLHDGGEIMSLDRSRDAWTLDKYKNIHTAQKAHQLRPDKSWYFFIDADTYIVWPNLFAWLKRLDPNEKLYLGSVVDVGKPPFAHGGSGYLLSKAAMAELVGDDAKEIAATYDDEAFHGCCGDQELAKSLFEKGINSSNVRPMINGEKARAIPFGPTHWCQPLVTMHHMSPEEINDMWQYEGRREHPEDVLLMEDLYHTYIEPKIMPYREDWDNKSNDDTFKRSEDVDNLGGWWTFNKPYHSYNTCRKACKVDKRCFQFSYTDGECGFAASFKLGWKALPRDDWKMKSGWHMDKIEKFISENKCKGPEWDNFS